MSNRHVSTAVSLDDAVTVSQASLKRVRPDARMPAMDRPTLPQALTIAASDSGGGAGIQGDIKAMHANSVFALSVLVAVTAQNTRAVTAVHALPLEIIDAQFDAVFDDFEIGAIKTGMLCSAGIVRRVAERLRERNPASLVVDPVMVSSSGTALLEDHGIEALIRELFPLARVVTPNVPEAERLTGMTIRTLEDAKAAAAALFKFGPRAVLLKGGHLPCAPATDVLYDGASWTVFAGEWIKTTSTHGTGCAYSAAIAAHLARGASLADAVERAKRYVAEAIRHGLAIGRGRGPTHHLFNVRGDV